MVAIQCKCDVCGKTFRYDDEVGYAKNLCGSLCDGIKSGRAAERERIIKALNKIQRHDLEAKNWTQDMEHSRFGEWMRADDIAEALGLKLDKEFNTEQDSYIGFSE